MTSRTAALRDYFAGLTAAGPRRSLLFGHVEASLAETAGEPTPIRRAKALAYHLQHVDIVAHPHELLAGSVLCMWPLAEGLPPYRQRVEEGRCVLRGYLARTRRSANPTPRMGRSPLMDRDHYDSAIDFGDLQRMARELHQGSAHAEDLTFREVVSVLASHFTFQYASAREAMSSLPWFSSNHLGLKYWQAFPKGLGGLRDEIDRRLREATELDRRVFYRSTAIAIRAAIAFIGRYEARLRALSVAEADEQRQAELREMAEIVGRISGSAPATFREALQLTWLLHIIANLDGGASMSFSRFDQYLYPFYGMIWPRVASPGSKPTNSWPVSGSKPTSRRCAPSKASPLAA